MSSDDARPEITGETTVTLGDQFKTFYCAATHRWQEVKMRLLSLRGAQSATKRSRNASIPLLSWIATAALRPRDDGEKIFSL